MLAQAMSSTAPTTIRMIISGCSNRSRSPETPVLAGVSPIGVRRKSARYSAGHRVGIAASRIGGTDRVDRRGRGRDRLVRAEPGDDSEPEAVPAIERRFGAADGRLGGERQEQIHRLANFGTEESRRRDADNGERRCLPRSVFARQRQGRRRIAVATTGD